MTSIPRDSALLSKEDMEGMEKWYSAKYLLDCEFKDTVCSLFYTPKKHPEGSNFFIVSKKKDTTFISNGLKYAQKVRTGVLSPTITWGGVSLDEIIHSRYKYDYRSAGNDVFIDGGDSYIRISGSNLKSVNLVDFTFSTKGDLVVIKEPTKYNEEEE